MKKVALLLTGLLAVLMMAGCGGEGSSSSVSANPNSGGGGSVEVVSGVGESAADVTTPETPLSRLSMGTPPGLPE